ncbi:MAG: hypothetical protein IIW93_09085 [Bacteroidaceae bacterium]|jgi:hypothetical protein|nr:hypothetical protein [Bacteroidaceae bacterium]MBO5965451.1 hypothetical protein [Bacteroidaceae bacterium]MBQ2362774.1 hypothetical protein [Bacteroidaceae bacterium]MBQ5393027.1 hypothetical protein [Bacteroidaceae bacterium]MBQ5693933.1 hypothetical protein [Bacteroidaceae bacterium]
MNKYESSVKTVYAPVERVYARLSDLNNIQPLKEKVDDPRFEELINSQVPADKRPTPEQFQKLRNNIRNLELTQDTLSGHIGPLGDITLRIVERAEPKLVKMELEGAPIQVTLWIQMLPNDENTSRLKVTIGAELNFFIRKMIESKLEKAPEGLAQVLSQLPY